MKKRRAPGASISGILVQLLPITLLAVLFAGVGVVHVSSRVVVVHAGYRMSQLELESRALAREYDELRLERATLLSSARLERIAQEKLGLVPPLAGSVLSVRRAPLGPAELQAVSVPSRGDRATAVSVANRVGR